MKSQTQIYLIDPQSILRNGLKTIFTTRSGFALAGEGERLCAEVETIVAIRPQMLLVTIAHADTEGLAALRTIREQLPDCKILVLGETWQDGWVRACVSVGADGFQLKTIAPDALFNSVQQLAQTANLAVMPNQSSAKSKRLSRIGTVKRLLLPQPLPLVTASANCC